MPSDHSSEGTPWDTYPFNEPGFIAEQRGHAKHVVFDGDHERVAGVTLVPGRRYEIWPGGTLVNEHGTVLGHFTITSPPDNLPELHR